LQTEENKVNMKNNLLKIAAVFMAMLCILAAAETGDAQTRRARGITASKQQIEDLFKRIEERTDRFSNSLNKSLDRSRLDGTKTEDRIDERAKDLENATDELRREFDFNDTRGETKVNVRKVLSAAMVVNRIMNRRNFSRPVETSWVNLRAEINSLARIYGLPGVGQRAN
jgi:septal ring factor EnvC (AmiA/AmiB activator)